MPDQRSLKHQMLDAVNDIEIIANKVIDIVTNGLENADIEENENLLTLAEAFNAKYLEFKNYAESIPQHMLRAAIIEHLQIKVNKRSEIIIGLSEELVKKQRILEQAIYEAEKKLKEVRISETNRIHSEDVIRLAHQYSKSFAISSPDDWRPGDPRRPYPTEADFAVSHLMKAQLAASNATTTASTSITVPATPTASLVSSASMMPLSSSQNNNAFSNIRQQLGSNQSPLNRSASNNAHCNSSIASGNTSVLFQQNSQSKYGRGIFPTQSINDNSKEKLSGNNNNLTSPSLRVMSSMQQKLPQSPHVQGMNMPNITLENPQSFIGNSTLSSGINLYGSNNTTPSLSNLNTNNVAALTSNFSLSSANSNDEKQLETLMQVDQMTSDSSSSSTSDNETS